MGDRSAIEWTGATWNPFRARRREVPGEVGWICVRISPGCVNCYAATMNAWRGNGEDYTVPGLGRVEPFLDENALALPLRWKAPRKIFVCSMTDLFGEWVLDDWIATIFAVMKFSRRHTFQVLTKRPERMREWMSRWDPSWASNALGEIALRVVGHDALDVGEMDLAPGWPPENVQLGVSVENQATADERIPLLLQTPAAARWVSYEPALAAVDFTPWLGGREKFTDSDGYRYTHQHQHGLDWLVVGGESGPGSRPFDLAWARATIAQCRAAGVPVFVKQLGAFPVDCAGYLPEFKPHGHAPGADGRECQVGLEDRKGGSPEEWPADLRVREFPPDAVSA